MAVEPASLLLFAIRSVLRLGQRAQAAYVDATRRRELTLPLPKFFNQLTVEDAVDFFRSADRGGPYVVGHPELPGLLQAFRDGTLTEDDRDLLKTLHVEYANVRRAERGELVWPDGPVFDGAQMRALVTVRQWRRGADPTPSTLKRMSGTLLEIGVDYAVQNPTLFDENSSHGRALKGFLESLDEFDFASTDGSEFPARFFVAVMETAADVPQLLSGDPKAQELVRTASRAISQDVAGRIDEIASSNLDAIAQREAFRRIEDWGELVLRSTLSSSAELVFSNPGRYLRVKDDARQELIGIVARNVLGLVLDDEGVDLAALFSRDALEGLLDTVLEMVAEHPEILTVADNEGISALLSGLAKDLASFDLLEGNLFPEVVRLVLKRSSENLTLLWPDLAGNPRKNLAAGAVMKTLEILTRKPTADEPWKLRLSEAQLIELADSVLDEMAANPGWLLNTSGNVGPALGQVLESALGVVRRRGDLRLSPRLATEILQSALRAGARRKEFLAKLPASAARAGERLLQAAIDTVLKAVFDEQLGAKAAWQLVRHEVVVSIVDESLKVLARHKLDAVAIDALDQVLTAEINALLAGRGFVLQGFSDALNEQFT